MIAQLERRILPAPRSGIRVTKRNSGAARGGMLFGHAAVYNSLSDDLGGFREVIRPGAFERCLERNPDVRALINHDPSLLIARTRSGTLWLFDATKGLRFEADLPETSYARDLAASLQRGDMTQCSFGFVTRRDDWSEKPIDGELCLLRELLDVDLFDVSVVTFPAYADTDVALRSLARRRMPVSNDTLRLRLQLLALE
jgi:uncharacterized protein